MGRRLVEHLVALLVLALAFGPNPAYAHGPCDCLTPPAGPPGTTVSTWAGYKVVFNPDRTDLPTGPRPLWQEHRPGITPTVVFRETYSYADLPLKRPVEFRVPEVPTGRYLVSVYDGSEGGAHYTWEHFEVTKRETAGAAGGPSEPPPPPVSQAAAVSLQTAVVIGLVALLFGLLLGAMASRRRLASAQRDAPSTPPL